MRLPNRDERKAYNKAHKTHYTLQDFALMYAIDGIQKGQDISWLKPYLPMDLIAHKDNWDLFPDGTKAKLNYDGIMSRPPKYLSDEFKAWVEENKEEEFTLFRDPEDKNRNGLLALHYVDAEKDTDFSKTLLFDLYSDLFVYSELENTYVNPQKIEDLENQIANVKESLRLCDALDIDTTLFSTYEESKQIISIREALEEHEDGKKIIADPVEWQNMDSILQNILEKETTTPETEEQPQEDGLEVAAEEVVEEKTTEGGEE